MKIKISPILLGLLLTSCATSSLKYAPTLVALGRAPGAVVWAGVQYDVANIFWWQPTGQDTSRLAHFDSGDAGFMVESLKTVLGPPPEVVTFTPAEKKDVESRTLLNQHRFAPLWVYGVPDGLVITDAGTEGLYPAVAEALGKKSPADYFLVLDADFVRFRLPGPGNLHDLRFQVELALAAYDRRGHRVASEYWTTTFAHQKGNLKDFATYRDAVQKVIQDHSADIQGLVSRLSR